MIVPRRSRADIGITGILIIVLDGRGGTATEAASGRLAFEHGVSAGDGLISTSANTVVQGLTRVRVVGQNVADNDGVQDDEESQDVHDGVAAGDLVDTNQDFNHGQDEDAATGEPVGSFVSPTKGIAETWPQQTEKAHNPL